jgi:hypothetical protein
VAEDDQFDETRIAGRVAFLRQVADGLGATVFRDERVRLLGGRIPLLARGYFVLSENYKAWRIETGHYTEPPKIAALMAIAIITFQPFKPDDARNVRTLVEARCNEMYALSCAGSVLGRPIDAAKKNFYLRLLDVLSEARSETLEPYLVDTRLNIMDRPLTDYLKGIHDQDKLAINSLITIFELFSGRYG